MHEALAHVTAVGSIGVATVWGALTGAGVLVGALLGVFARLTHGAIARLMAVGAVPSDVVTITFGGSATLTEGVDYRVDLAFSDNDGPHNAEYPSLSQPGSIQQLEGVILSAYRQLTSHLGHPSVSASRSRGPRRRWQW